MTSTSTANLNHCPHCGNYHTGQCRLIKAIEYYADGTVKRIEFFEPAQAYSGLWQTQPSPYQVASSVSAFNTSVINSTVMSKKVPLTFTG